MTWSRNYSLKNAFAKANTTIPVILVKPIKPFKQITLEITRNPRYVPLKNVFELQWWDTLPTQQGNTEVI
jgi:hypothetical protein